MTNTLARVLLNIYILVKCLIVSIQENPFNLKIYFQKLMFEMMG